MDMGKNAVRVIGLLMLGVFLAPWRVEIGAADEGIVVNDFNSVVISNSASNTDHPNVQAVKILRQLIDTKYSYRDLRGIDWNKIFSVYGPKMEHARTMEEFAEIAAKMLSVAKDGHLWINIGDKKIGGYKYNVQRNYQIDFLQKTVPNWVSHNKRVSTGRFEDGIGYILITSWSNTDAGTLERAFDALKTFSACRGLIIDVRPNGGGDDKLASEFAGCFVSQPVVCGKVIIRDDKIPGGWSELINRELKPSRGRPSYRGKIAVLMGQANMSSCESFLLMMKQVPQCKLIGDKTVGSSGCPKPYDLGNGVTVYLPSWKALFLDGNCSENVGIRPDIPVRTNENELCQRDPVLEKALLYLRHSKP